MRIVLDTSVLIAALRAPDGLSAAILVLIIQGKATLLMDYKIAMEYREVAMRPEHLSIAGKAEDSVLAVIEELEALADPVLVGARYRPMSSDYADDMLIDVAVNGHADAIVTHNTKHFASARNFGIAVLTPFELITKLKRQIQ